MAGRESNKASVLWRKSLPRSSAALFTEWASVTDTCMSKGSCARLNQELEAHDKVAGLATIALLSLPDQ
jgi:hypothetical protein